MSSNIIYRGTLTKDKLKELAKVHLGFQGDDTIYNPTKNHDVISITKQLDGNYIGHMWRTDHLAEVRQGDPSTVLTMLITHQ